MSGPAPLDGQGADGAQIPRHGPAQQPLDAPHDALFRGDVLQEVLCRLDTIPDLATAALVNRAWRAAVRDDLPWRRVYVRQYGEPHAWEACGSYREQCSRRAGLRWPHASPPLPGAPAPGAQLESYDRSHGVRTLAVSYDPASRALLRAVRSRALLGDDVRVAVQAIPLGVPGAPKGSAAATGSAAAAAGPAAAAAAGPAAAAATGSATAAGAAGSLGAGGVSGWPGESQQTEEETTAAAADDDNDESSWVCMVSADGRHPPPPPPPEEEFDGDAAAAATATATGGGQYLTEDCARQIAQLAELLPKVMCSADGLLYLPAGPMGHGLAAWDLLAVPATSQPISSGTTPTSTSTSREGASAEGTSAAGWRHRELQHSSRHPHQRAPAPQVRAHQPYWLLSEAHPGRLLAAAADGGLVVSGCDGGRLRFWEGRRRDGPLLGEADISNLTRLPVLDAFPLPAARAGAGRHSLWIAVCEASGTAAVVLASPLAPMVMLFRATPRGYRCRTADGGGGGAAASVGGGGGGGGGGGVGQLLAIQTFGGAPCNGLQLFRKRMLTVQVLCSDVLGARFGGSGGSSVLVTVVVCMWRLPEGSGAGDNDGDGDGHGDGDDGGDDDGGKEGEVARAEERDGHWSDDWTRLFSSRLQLEHPRTLVLGRMRPLLAASEDLMLLTVPRNVGGRPPHSQVLALELPPPTHGSSSSSSDDDDDGIGAEEGADGRQRDEGEDGAGRGASAEGGEPASGASASKPTSKPTSQPGKSGAGAERPLPKLRPAQLRGGGGGRMAVVPEEQRLQWVQVVEDAAEVVVAVVPTPGHLALLSEDGRLRLYGIIPEAAVPADGSLR